jgi:hypothetical protein
MRSRVAGLAVLVLLVLPILLSSCANEGQNIYITCESASGSCGNLAIMSAPTGAQTPTSTLTIPVSATGSGAIPLTVKPLPGQSSIQALPPEIKQ